MKVYVHGRVCAHELRALGCSRRKGAAGKLLPQRPGRYCARAVHRTTTSTTAVVRTALCAHPHVSVIVVKVVAHHLALPGRAFTGRNDRRVQAQRLGDPTAGACVLHACEMGSGKQWCTRMLSGCSYVEACWVMTSEHKPREPQHFHILPRHMHDKCSRSPSSATPYAPPPQHSITHHTALR
jgi:hypothetical protein